MIWWKTAWKTKDEGSEQGIGGGNQNHPQEKEMKKAKWLSEEALQIPEIEGKQKAKKKIAEVNKIYSYLVLDYKMSKK